jgi:hypothetical protein
MTSRSIFVALLFLAIACRREVAETPAQPATVTNTTTVAGTPKDLTGQKVDRTVPIPPPPVTDCIVKSAAGPNEPVDFTMHIAEAPEKLHVSVRILQGDEEIAFVRQPAEGKKVATLRLPKLEPGKYRLEGLWGGNLGCEREIEIREK